MNKENAISILIQGVEIAQSKGVFNLKDAGIIAQAVAVLSVKPVEKKEDPKPVEEKVKKTK